MKVSGQQGRIEMASPTIVEIDTSSYPVYDTDDLAYFQRIVDAALADVAARRDGLLDEDEWHALKVRLAVALFKAAEDGERDFETLKSTTIAAVAPARSRPNAAG
jgi:hypothetical protein